MKKILLALLSPLGLTYSALMAARRMLYDKGVFKTYQPKAPTISVGNISMGGSGKTPLTSYLLSQAGQKGLKAFVLTRGYKSKPPKLPYFVTGTDNPASAGDEPLMLAKMHAEAGIAVDPMRSRAAEEAWKIYKPDLFILDDGFQHLGVKRNLNLALFKPEDLNERWNRVFPAGAWREGESALQAADAFLIKVHGSKLNALLPLIEYRLKQFDKPVFSFFPRACRLVRVKDGAEPLKPFRGNYILFSGVGSPSGVETTAKEFIGYPPLEHVIYADHYKFSVKDLKELARKAERKSCDFLLCTPKDAVKISSFAPENVHTFTLEITFGDSVFTGCSFEEWLDISGIWKKTGAERT